MPVPRVCDDDGAAAQTAVLGQSPTSDQRSLLVSYPSRRARTGHVLLVAAGWVVFGLLWARVLARPGARDAIQSTMVLLLALVAVVTLVTWAWIAHNVALARRRGGRRAGTPARVVPERDLLGRVLLVDPDVARAGLIVVSVDEVGKTFSGRSVGG